MALLQVSGITKTDNTNFVFTGMYNDSIYGLYANGWKTYFDMKNARIGIGETSPAVTAFFPGYAGKKDIYVSRKQRRCGFLVFSGMS